MRLSISYLGLWRERGGDHLAASILHKGRCTGFTLEDDLGSVQRGYCCLGKRTGQGSRQQGAEHLSVVSLQQSTRSQAQKSKWSRPHRGWRGRSLEDQDTELHQTFSVGVHAWGPELSTGVLYHYFVFLSGSGAY